MSRNTLISNDLFLSPIHQGVRLSSSRVNGPRTPISTLMKQPFNIYFVNNHFELNKINSTCADMCGFDSEHSAIGKLAIDFASQESANFAVYSDKQVMLEKKTKMYDQDFLRKDGTVNQYLTIKSPWYDNEDNVIGVFGCSIALGVHSMAQALIFLSELGLLTSNISQSIASFEKTKLSRQQLACAKLLITGLSAKEIASHLNLSYRTVEAYVENMKYKLNCRNKTDLALKLLSII